MASGTVDSALKQTFPINRLPPELLDMVFVMACPIPPCSEREDPVGGRRFSWTISQVCKSWRHRAVNISRLWDYLRTSELVVVPSLLQRSKGLPLCIVMRRGDCNRAIQRGPSEPIKAAVNQIMQDWHRIRDLHIRVGDVPGNGTDELSFINSFVCKPNLQLENLQLDADFGSYTKPQLLGNYPSLNRVRLNWIDIPWDGLLSLSSLRELSLFPFRPHSQDILSFFPTIFYHNPNLEVFEFTSEDFFESVRIPIPSPPITLKHLSKLIISASSTICIHILDHLDTPSLIDAEVILDDFPWDHPIVILPRFLSLRTPISFTLQFFDEGDMALLYCIFEWPVSTAGPHRMLKLKAINFRFQEEVIFPTEVLLTFSLFLGSPNFRGIETFTIVDPSYHPISGVDLRYLLRAMPLIQELVMIEAGRLLSALDLEANDDDGRNDEAVNEHRLAVLRLQPEDGEALTYACPRLTVLHLVQSKSDDIEFEFDSQSFYSKLPAILRGRREAGCPIRTLCLKGDWFDRQNSDMQMLQGLVDEIRWVD